eukprot:12029923-Alexandrium_andersonii.AAC.1
MPAVSSLRAGPSRRRPRLLTLTRLTGIGDSSSPHARPAVQQGRARLGLRDPQGPRVWWPRHERVLGAQHLDDRQPNPQQC